MPSGDGESKKYNGEGEWRTDSRGQSSFFSKASSFFLQCWRLQVYCKIADKEHIVLFCVEQLRQSPSNILKRDVYDFLLRACDTLDKQFMIERSGLNIALATILASNDASDEVKDLSGKLSQRLWK